METTNVENYLEQLASALQRRGADSQQTSEAVAEAERQIKQSGGDPADTLGPPDSYAERVVRQQERAAGSAWDQRTFRATAFDEMELLKDAGRQGWELTDVGLYALHCRRPHRIEDATQWEYTRRVGVDRKGMLEMMTELGWTPCGTWMPFQYFKRALKKPAELPG